MKWGNKEKDMCYNDVACFFLRMTAGPMDYTPAAMDNYKIGDYRGNGTNPGSVGTRCHQMALMALYEAPLQMLSDSPTKYEKNMECFAFMAKTPVVWDDTVGLGGCPESFAAAARKAKDGSWYAAAISNKDARDFAFKTCFLGDGEWKAEIFRDAGDPPAHAADLQIRAHEQHIVDLGLRQPAHEFPAVRNVFAEAVHLQAAESLPDRRPAGLVTRADLRFIQTGITRKLPGQDIPEQFFLMKGTVDDVFEDFKKSGDAR